MKLQTQDRERGCFVRSRAWSCAKKICWNCGKEKVIAVTVGDKIFVVCHERAARIASDLTELTERSLQA